MLFLGLLLKSMIRHGTLVVVDGNGATHRYGDGADPKVTIRIGDAATARRLAFNSAVEVGEAYMDGRLLVENGDIYDFLALAMSNIGITRGHALQRLGHAVRALGKRMQQYNPIGRAQRNVAHHYDLTGELYDLFLDADRQYSCAYYMSQGDSLEQAQAQKKRHIAAKLLLRPGQRVLDIGSGWGGLAFSLAETADVEVVGLTLSEEQFKVSNRRAAERGLAGRVRFELKDYRLEQGRYDRIVSVGMFEHVGIGHYGEFFRKLHGLLAEDGVALLHTIGRADGPGVTNPWIRKYIFPGGYSPALSEVMPAIERAALYATDIEVLRLHYAETLKAWRRRFNQHRERIRDLFDERFCRMWEFYLAASEATFRFGGHVNFQIQLARRVDVVPMTRDYMFEWERATPLPRVRGREGEMAAE
ncbi:MAG: class I SAM-dependent methyltransferase [Alphaproteobacteria bacterium]|nr:class I SAM-dependent methyltransferase [Alphaproteobacteria bacterium]